MFAADHSYFALPGQHQRDLIWSLFGPPLLDCDWSPAKQPWLPDQWQPLAEQLSNLAPDFNSPRLGLIFEQLWQQYLQLSGIRFLANVQIIDQGKTLGELDLLLDNGQQQWHLELALKFYLGYGNEQGQHWVGPNRADLLARKIRHTHEHQLPMRQNPQTQQQLSELNWQPQASLAVMRGCLFYPANPAYQANLPPEVATDHWRGHWCHAQQAADYLPKGRWYVLAKPQWLSPALTTFSIGREELLEYLRTHFRHLTYPCCVIQTEEGQYGWAEQQRWLIMPDDWPHNGTHKNLPVKLG